MGTPVVAPGKPAPNTTCAVCGAGLRCGAVGDGTTQGASCWCSLEAMLPASAWRPGQGCRCQRCLREAIAQANAAGR